VRNIIVACSRGLSVLLALSLLLLLAVPITILAQDTGESEVFASVRVYAGVDPAGHAEIARLTSEGFLPIMRESDGFVGYYLLPAGDMLAAISLFDSAEQASASNEKARDFVTQNLAPLLPNEPTILAGTLDLWHLAALDDMMRGDSDSTLYAALRLYDNYDLTGRAESVELVETIFVPMQQEAGGLFNYFTMNDGVDRVAALSVYDTAANALAANELAAEFMAEYLPDSSSEEPTRINGSLAVAAFAELNEGANLVADSVFASVRVYAGIDPADQAEIARLTADGFLPIMRESDGFVGYYLMSAGDMLAAISLFDSAEQATASNEAAREFVAENLTPLLPNAPQIFEGSLSINHVAALDDSDDAAGVSELYASIRLYEGFDLMHFEEANDLAISHLLPALQDLGGFFALFALNDGEDTVVGISIFDSEAASLAANDVGKAFTIEYFADWAPNPPTGPSGKLAIASQAEINMGENLVGAMMEG